MAEKKRVTLHPLNPDGSVDLNVNLYPKAFIDGIVNRDGEEVEVPTKPEVQASLGTKQDTIPDLDEIRSGANLGQSSVQPSTFEEAIDALQASVETKQNQLVAGVGITIEDDVISSTGGGSGDINDLVKHLSFHFDERERRVEMDSRVEEWLSEESTYEKVPMLLSINESTPYLCNVNHKFDERRGYKVTITSETFGVINLNCSDVQESSESESWGIDLSMYFQQGTSDNDEVNEDFSLRISMNVEDKTIGRDNLISPDWVSDVGKRLEFLTQRFFTIKAWLGLLQTGEVTIEPVDVYATRGDKDEYVVHLQTSNGEYKLTYSNK